ncbi:hypothetical protein SAT01_16640 [Sinomonas atrocyanea]|nr:hypothetical protein SAT01_16640 [Sinomonas atrocyanea]GGG57317.1 hypothetical protein GCM10007172_05240 [Sinomonas atrocyanea]
MPHPDMGENDPNSLLMPWLDRHPWGDVLARMQTEHSQRTDRDGIHVYRRRSRAPGDAWAHYLLTRLSSGAGIEPGSASSAAL